MLMNIRNTMCINSYHFLWLKNRKLNTTHNILKFLSNFSQVLYHLQTYSRSMIWTTFLSFQVLGRIFSRWKLTQHEAPREHTQESKVKKRHVYLFGSLFSALHLMLRQMFSFRAPVLFRCGSGSYSLSFMLPRYIISFRPLYLYHLINLRIIVI